MCFPCAHRPFSACSPHVFRALNVHGFAFTIHQPLAFTVRKAFFMRSPCVHRAFIVRSTFRPLSLHCPSERQSERVEFDWEANMKKEPVHKSGRKLSYSIRNLIVKYNLYGLLTVKIHRKIQSTQQLDLFCGCLFIACIPNDRVLKVWSITYTHVNYRCLYSANY